MPKVWEDEVELLKSKGLDEQMAYAIATKHFKKKYGMTPQRAKKIGFEPEKKAGWNMLDIIAAVGLYKQAEESYPQVSGKAHEWGALLAGGLGKIAETYTAERKEDPDKKALKRLLGIGALGTGLYFGLRGHSKAIAATRAKLTAESKPLRDVGATLVKAVQETKANDLKKFKDTFSTVSDPYKRNVIMNTTKDIDDWLNEAGRTLRPSEKADVHKTITSMLDDLEASDTGVDYRGAVQYLRDRANNRLLPR